MNNKFDIRIAKNIGFCFGVERAIKILLERKSSENVFVLGEIVHNLNVIQNLESLGVRFVEKIEEIPRDSIVIIRAHGVALQIYDNLEKLGHEVVDATCPFVKKIHKIVLFESESDRFVIVVGDKSHPEIIGIESRAQSSIVFSEREILSEDFEIENYDIPNIANTNGASVVFQTTFKKSLFSRVVEKLSQKFVNIKFFDTICTSTEVRQREAVEISKWSDIFFVIGGRNSSNASKLVECGKEFCGNTFLLEKPKDVEKYYNKFKNNCKIGMVAGASTPKETIKELCEKMSGELTIDLSSANLNGEIGSSEPQNDYIYREGDEVVGIIKSISPNEIKIQIGDDDIGYIDIAEFNNDFEKLRVNQEINGQIIAVLGSGKRYKVSCTNIDKEKAFKSIEEAFASGEILRARVHEIVNGGLIVICNGIKVFIPASQVSDKFIKDLGIFLNEEIEFRIIDIIHQRGIRKIVGSSKEVILEKKHAAKTEFWDNAEVSAIYSGHVRSLTNFGAFVDLGGVDGLLHVSEISWWKLSHPGQTLKENDKVQVFIKYLDKEKEKVSLGYKRDTSIPINHVKADDIIVGVVTGITGFGLFVDVGGADGLVHISELSWDRISDPSVMFSVGDKIEVYVKSIDQSEGKISLGYRKEKDNPWNKFMENYKIGDIIDCKVTRILPFGVFAEIAARIEGLIHVSEVSNKKISKPSDVVAVGDYVKARIISIDFKNKHIALSMKGLNEFDSEDFGGYTANRSEFASGDSYHI